MQLTVTLDHHCIKGNTFNITIVITIIHINNIINITTISVITDCTLQDTSYTGNWFCSQISVCEAYISDSRECIKSKGCAKEEQCTCVNSNCQSTTLSSTDGSAVYAGPLTNSGENPGGYTIDIYCCQSKIFPSDDLVAINYNDICNSASKFSYSISFIIMMFVTILFILSI